MHFHLGSCNTNFYNTNTSAVICRLFRDSVEHLQRNRKPYFDTKTKMSKVSCSRGVTGASVAPANTSCEPWHCSLL